MSDLSNCPRCTMLEAERDFAIREIVNTAKALGHCQYERDQLREVVEAAKVWVKAMSLPPQAPYPDGYFQALDTLRAAGVVGGE